MKLKPLLAAAAAVAALSGAGVASAVTVETTNFLASVSNFNGFEGSGGNFPGNAYTEGGITVEYVGSATIVSLGGGEGSVSWYENGGGTGYTRVTLNSGDAFSAIRFRIGSGWSTGAFLQYELLNDGVLVATGDGGAVDGCCLIRDYRGFSGGLFDEVRLQVQSTDYLPITGFDPGAYEAGAYDAFAIGIAGVVPEPASWALMIGGFGMAGAMIRRRKAALA